jgi:hypothetical protein
MNAQRTSTAATRHHGLWVGTDGTSAVTSSADRGASGTVTR